MKALETAEYNRGMWDMFVLISSAWHGKQYYFKQNNGIVYSRESGTYMTVNEAYNEFISKLTDY